MAYNVRGHEYRYFKKQTDKQNDNKYSHSTPIPTSEKYSDEDYSQLTRFHHTDELYSNFDPKPRRFRKHTRSYERRFTINPAQTFVTIRSSNGCVKAEVSGNIHPNDYEILKNNIHSLPVGLTLTLTEVFQRIDE